MIERKEVKCKHCFGGQTPPISLITKNTTEHEECVAQKKRDNDKLPSASTKQQAFTNITRYAKDSKRWEEITAAISVLHGAYS